MKRSTFDGRTTVYQYGSPANVVVTDEAMAQLRLANRLWNDLVEIHRDHEELVAAAWASRPEVAEAEARLEAATTELGDACEAATAAKKDGRSRNAVPAELRDRIRSLRAAKKEAKQAFRAAKDAAYDTMKPTFEALKAEMYAATKATYATRVQTDGLYWATYNSVRADFDTALARVATARRQGRPADLRFHRFTGEGTWTVQLQREASDPPRTFAALAGGDSKWRNTVRIAAPAGMGAVSGLITDHKAWAGLARAERRAAARTTMSIRIGSNGREPVWLTVPVTVHRPVPPDADITEIQVTRRRVGTHYRHSVSITARRPAAAPAGRPGLVAIDLGWRRMPDGAIRVAVWEATRPIALDLADQVRSWVRQTGNSGEVRVPTWWCDEVERMDKVQSLRDEKLNAVRSELVAWLQAHPAAAQALAPAATGDRPNPDPLTPANVAKWRSPARLAALALSWRAARQPDDETMFDRLEAWRRQDRHLLEWVANTRDQLAANRREAYRVLAARLADSYGTVVMEDMALPDLATKGSVEEPADQQADLARAQARMASPGQLRSAIHQAAEREGVTYIKLPSAGTTRVHADCGTWLDQDTASSITMWCPSCETRFDQDVNAARNLLRLATGEVTELGRPSAPTGQPPSQET